MNNNTRANGAGPSGAPATQHNDHPLDNVLSGDQDGTLLQMNAGLFNLGYNRAVQSGATGPDAEAVRSLDAHASAIARDTYRELYDPAVHAHDRLRQTEHDRNLRRREEEEIGLAHAMANVHDSNLKLAATPKAGTKPSANRGLAAVFVGSIALTLAPTLHDFFFFAVPDPMLQWFFSALGGLCVGAMVGWAILSGRRSKVGWLGVVGGLVVGAGFAWLRLANAHGSGEIGFAVGLSLAEMGAVLMLEWLASGLRTREANWEVAKDAEDKAVALRDAEQAEADRRKRLLDIINLEIAKLIAYVEDRNTRNIHLPELEAMAIKAVHDGYSGGIEKNRGRVRGVLGRSQ